VLEHRSFLERDGLLHKRRRERDIQYLKERVNASLQEEVERRLAAEGQYQEIASQVKTSVLDPYTAADCIVKKFLGQLDT
jgi:putative protein kinase ArgK-like GTPase of G3E family